jgi:hypothetical protein
MKLFSNSRTRRYSALVVLLVWLFAVASGVANACLLEVRTAHGQAVSADLPMVADRPAEMPAHAGAVASHDDQSGNPSEPCLKVCDDGSSTMPTPPAEEKLTDVDTAPVVAILWTAATLVVSNTPRRVELLHPPEPGHPLRVRYSRLAL